MFYFQAGAIRALRIVILKSCIVGRSDGQIAVGSLSLDAFEHVLKRVVEEACASGSVSVRERASSVASGGQSVVEGERVKVPSNFAGSVRSDVQSTTSKSSEGATIHDFKYDIRNSRFAPART